MVRKKCNKREYSKHCVLNEDELVHLSIRRLTTGLILALDSVHDLCIFTV